MDSHVSSGAPSLDQQLQQYVRGAAARDRDVERIGPFLATFDQHSTIPYLSYAVPDDGARPTSDDIVALVDAYARHDRLPRLEYLPIAAPAVEAALVASGFLVDARLPVMTCEAGAATDLAPDGGIVIAVPSTDEDFRAMRTAQHAAFGEIVTGGEAQAGGDSGEVGSGVDDAAGNDDDAHAETDELARQRARLRDGGLALLARDVATGQVVGGGVATVPGDGVTEIAGVGVRSSHRRRGIAGAVTAGLARAAHAAGTGTVWLTPGGDGAHRVYTRAGFTDTTTMIHLSKPAS